jgi:signal transduction histidine kinase
MSTKRLNIKSLSYLISILILLPSWLASNPTEGNNQLKLDSTKVVLELNQVIGNLNGIENIKSGLLKFSRSNANAYILEDTYWYNLSKVYFLSGQLESAFASADSGLVLSKKNKNEYRSAKFYNLRASVFSYQQKYLKAIEEFKTALKIVENYKDQHTAALIKNNIGNIFFGLSDYQSAFEYSQESYNQLKSEKDTVNLPAVAGVAAISALKIKKAELGKLLAKESMSLSERYKNPVGLIVANHSFGELFSSEVKYDSALVYFNRSLELSEKFRQANFVMLNKIGLQHSYLKLIDYKRSIAFGIQALEESKLLGNENTLYAINKTLGFAYAGNRDYANAYNHMQLAHEYYIKSAGIENQKAINEILIKYDSEKKENEIANNKIEIIEKENSLIRRNQWILMLSAILLILILGYALYYRIQKQRINQLKKEQEAELMESVIQAEEIERERIANELHDGMASSITGIKIKLEEFARSSENDKLIPLVAQLTLLHEETRRVSHNLMPLNINGNNWAERISNYCLENSNSQFKIKFSNNLKHIPEIEVNTASILYRITQELIHNVMKHAKTNFCYVQLSEIPKGICVSVEDEGVGFKEGNQEGIGLSSIRKRMNILNGELEIDSKNNHGTLVTIRIKL